LFHLVDRRIYAFLRYIEAFVPNLKQFVEKFGNDGREELNTMCPKHQLVFAPQEATTFSYGGLEIKDGLLRLVFQEKNLGVNTSDVSKGFADALKDAPPPSGASALNLVARNWVREYYDPEIENVREAIAEIVGMENLKLTPNFEQNATELAKLNGPSGWDTQIGRATLEYFQSVQSALERQGFKGDEMLQEGFQEAVDKGEICFRVVEKLKTGSYNEVIIEDGILYAQVRVRRILEASDLTISPPDYPETMVCQYL
jgi:hypothetical protein